jgi:hypothetical protein
MQTAGKDRTVELVTIPASSKPPCIGWTGPQIIGNKFFKDFGKN